MHQTGVSFGGCWEKEPRKSLLIKVDRGLTGFQSKCWEESARKTMCYCIGLSGSTYTLNTVTEFPHENLWGLHQCYSDTWRFPPKEFRIFSIIPHRKLQYCNSCSQSVPPFQALPNVFMYIWNETDCSLKLKEDSDSHFQNVESEKWELKIRLDVAPVWETISKTHTWEEATLDSTNRTLFEWSRF